MVFSLLSVMAQWAILWQDEELTSSWYCGECDKGSVYNTCPGIPNKIKQKTAVNTILSEPLKANPLQERDEIWCRHYLSQVADIEILQLFHDQICENESGWKSITPHLTVIFIFLTLMCWWLIWPIQNDAKKLKNYWNPGTLVPIWEYSARAFQWIPTWHGLNGCQKYLRSMLWTEVALALEGLTHHCWDTSFLWIYAFFEK